MKNWVIVKEVEGGYIVEDCQGYTHYIDYQTYHKYND